MLAILVLGGLGVVVLSLLMAYYYHIESGRLASTECDSPEYERRFQAASPEDSPETELWQDGDGTPHGAIEARLGG